MSNSPPVRIALIGCGIMGVKLADTFQRTEGAEIAYICDPRPDLKDAIANKPYLNVKTSDDYKIVLDDSTVDAVVISAPTSLHYAIAKNALQAGKHVFIEKPMAQTTAQAKELQALAQKNNRCLTVNHVLFYEEAARWMQENLSVLGKGTHYTHIRIHELIPERADHCCIEAHAPHALYMADMLDNFASESVTVSAHSANTKLGYKTKIKFSSGFEADIDIAKRQLSRKNEETRHTDVRFDGIEGTNFLSWDERVPGIKEESLHANINGVRIIPPIRHDVLPLDNIAAEFVETVRGSKRPMADATRGIRVQQIMDAIHQSIETGKEVETLLDAADRSPFRNSVLINQPPFSRNPIPTTGKY